MQKIRLNKSGKIEFTHPVIIQKSQADGDRIRIKLKASSETEDREGEKILKSAFANTDMQGDFRKQGYYDYNHLTDIIDSQCRGASPIELVELQKAKTEAIIGYPDPGEKGLYIGEDGVYSEGFLIPSNKFVQEIRKGLESGWKGYGASISGEADPKDIQGNIIKSLRLKKIAIQPVNESVNPDTFVSLNKSLLKLKNLRKGAYMIEDSLFDGDGLHSEAEEEKHLAISDLRITLLEKKLNMVFEQLLKNPEFMESVSSEISEGMRTGEIPLDFESIRDHLIERYCFDPEQARELSNGLLIDYRTI